MGKTERLNGTLIKTLTPPSKKYTVTLSCCDPVERVHETSTDSLKRARKIFGDIKANEIRQGGGGEFTLSLFEHSEKTVRKCMYDDEKTPYYVFFEGSKELDSFGYMDLAGQWSKTEKENQGDDLCDKCMRSGVVVSRTDENGDTICVDCDEDE
jgi:hypothetical protein